MLKNAMRTEQILYFLFAVCLLVSCGHQPINPADPVVFAKAEDPELEKAKKEAVSKLDYFIESFRAHERDTTYHYSLKADFIEKGEHYTIDFSYSNQINKKQLSSYIKHSKK